MAATKDTAEREQTIIERLDINPDSDTATWIRQQVEAGAKDVDILFTLANGPKPTPAKFKRVPLDA